MVFDSEPGRLKQVSNPKAPIARICMPERIWTSGGKRIELDRVLRDTMHCDPGDPPLNVHISLLEHFVYRTLYAKGALTADDAGA